MSKLSHFEKDKYYMFSKAKMLEDYNAQNLIFHADDIEWAEGFNGTCIYIAKTVIGVKTELVRIGQYYISIKWCREITEERFSKAPGHKRFWYGGKDGKTKR